MNKLIIKQNTVTENVTVGLISKLYSTAKAIKDYEELNEIEDSQVELLGNLLVVHAYSSDVTYLEAKFPNLHINVTGGTYIRFVDPQVETILKNNNVGDGVGCTLLDLYNINELSGNVFFGSSITSFNEFLYFNPAILILQNLFGNCSSLTEITLPVGTTLIGSGWFGNCSNLVTINNTQSITSIYGLGGCSSLVSLNTPALTTVGNWGCMNCTSLTTIDLSHCTSIERNAFLNCLSLTNIDLSSCTSIGIEAFKGCTSLQTVSGFSNITSLSNSIFSGCTNLLSINGIDWSKITSIEAYVFYLCSNLILSNVNLSNVTSINTLAFYGSGITSISNISAGTTLSSKIFCECRSLISATNINKVSNSMFKDCSNLTTVSIGSSVSNISGGLFENCSNLVSLDINFQNITTIEQNSFANCSKLEFSSPIDLSNVTSIGAGSFQNCSKIIINKFPKISIYLQLCFSNIGNTTIIIPKEVQQLKNLCFGNSVNLQMVLFEVDSDPQLVSQLTCMLSAFKGCSNLEGPLSIPEGVTTLDGINFQNCSSLTSVTLPSTLTSMGIGEFLYSGVTSLTIKATTPPTITNSSLGWMSNNLIIYVPSESVSAYLSALYWNSYASKILAIP